MMSASNHLLQSIVISLLLFPAATALGSDELTKEFLDLKCRYILPGKNWKWHEVTDPRVVFKASDDKGHVVILETASIPQSTILDARYVEEFEKEFFGDGKMTKRGGRMENLLGYPCYLFEFGSLDGGAGCGRIFLANGRSYLLKVLGLTQPIAFDPYFHATMGGFHLTAPQTQASPATGQEPDAVPVVKISELMGGLAFWCLFAAAVIGISGWAIKKMKSRKA